VERTNVGAWGVKQGEDIYLKKTRVGHSFTTVGGMARALLVISS